MPFEKGGRADKQGNRYEINCIIYELLKVLNETNYSVVVEALGTDEIGTDILVTTFDGQKEHQQCKARNASKEYWDISDLKAKKNIFCMENSVEQGVQQKSGVGQPNGMLFLI